MPPALPVTLDALVGSLVSPLTDVADDADVEHSRG
jgi:hypothetical protein